ncbi:uncharacterized protein TM35_000142410 [Trypanosoma theileri]|uniref:Uncharacterized protein n=1 Tax=Trypanosoma theileri TaxID=67003 RepID=A0A1X0NXZ4_9TRYP|nr:uncharacterized protein TM35_000142410 [Trypanosoma theileri]ORC89030.1 hypothetical protein TM35_000142410 [Trypanosoma theileri]
MIGGILALVPVEKLRRYEAELDAQRQELQDREGSSAGGAGSATVAGNCVGGVPSGLRCEDHTCGHSLRGEGGAANSSHTSLDCGVREGDGAARDGHQVRL